MKVVIFGASGYIGRRMIDMLLLQGHQVTAYDRNIEQWLDKSIDHGNQLVIKGYLLDKKEVGKAIRGCQVVLFLVAGEREAGDVSRSGGMRQVLAGMRENKVDRLLVLGDALLLEDEEGKMIAERDDFPIERTAYAEENIKMWKQLQGAKLSWTMICPFQVTDGPESKAYITFKEKVNNQNIAPIVAGDLCRFIFREMTKNEFIHQKVGIISAD